MSSRVVVAFLALLPAAASLTALQYPGYSPINPVAQAPALFHASQNAFQMALRAEMMGDLPLALRAYHDAIRLAERSVSAARAVRITGYVVPPSYHLGVVQLSTAIAEFRVPPILRTHDPEIHLDLAMAALNNALSGDRALAMQSGRMHTPQA